MIDIYHCSDDGQGEEFWMCDDPLDTDDQNFVCSLHLADKEEMGMYERVIFSEKNRFACVQLQNKIKFFDISTAISGGINEEDTE